MPNTRKNRMIHQKTELLAPAGSYESFEAALGAGADAVYVGGAAFGARAYAQNFGKEELLTAIRTAHIHGKKLYLTVNTLLKNRELKEQLFDYLKPYYEAGLDAVIVQDMGVLRFIRRNFPGLPIHASTQMTVTGPEGMKFLEQQGLSRVVTARELSLQEIRAMHEASPIEIEAFIHGALCYSFSGQCLMSSLLGGRSGNRGRCAQPCRLPYRTGLHPQKLEGDQVCPLSLKDICTIDILPEILEAGVMSLKIEGRMKQPRYTAGVTEIYRKYLDLYLENGPEKYQVEEGDRQFLLDIFNRGGSCGGYFHQQNGPSMMAFSNEKKTAETAGELKKCKENIRGELMLYPENPAVLEVSCRGRRVSVSLGEVQYAMKQPVEEARVRQQMEKLGNTEFQWKKLEIHMGDSVFLPMKTLNELRREALEQLEQKLTEPYERAPAFCLEDSESCRNTGSRSGRLPIYVSCEKKEQALKLAENTEIQGMYLSFDAMKACMERGVQNRKELYLALPHMVRGKAPDDYLSCAGQWLKEGMKGFLVRNPEGYAILKEQGWSKLCVADHSLYTWNDEAVRFWREEGIFRNTVPLELNEKEIRHRDNTGSELVVYGYLPLMISAQCIRKNRYRCDRQEGMSYLKDRYEKVFPAVCFCHPWKTEATEKQELCYNIIYNSIPLGLLKEKEQVERLGVQSLRLAFTMEEPEEAAGILENFLDVYYRDGRPAAGEFTKGHFKRGAE